MEKSKRLKELEEIFSNWKGIEIGEVIDNSYIKLNESSFAILHSNWFKSADVLRVPVFRKEFGEDYAEKYKLALKKLNKANYRIERHSLLGTHLLRIVT